MILNKNDIIDTFQIEDISADSEAIKTLIKRTDNYINEYTVRDPLVAEEDTSTRTFECIEQGVLCVDDFPIGKVSVNVETIATPIKKDRVGVNQIVLKNDGFVEGEIYNVITNWGYLSYEEGQRKLHATALTISRAFISDVVKLEGDTTSESQGRLSVSYKVVNDFKGQRDVESVLNRYKVR